MRRPGPGGRASARRPKRARHEGHAGRDHDPGDGGGTAARADPERRDGEDPAEGEEPEAERRAAQEVARRPAGRGLAGSHPPDDEPGQREEGEEHGEPAEWSAEAPAEATKEAGDGQAEDHHPGDRRQPRRRPRGLPRITLPGNQEEGGDVQREAEAAGDGERDGDDADDDRVDAEVGGEAAADAAEDAVGARAVQALGLGRGGRRRRVGSGVLGRVGSGVLGRVGSGVLGVGIVGGHAPRLPARAPARHRESSLGDVGPAGEGLSAGRLGWPWRPDDRGREPAIRRDADRPAYRLGGAAAAAEALGQQPRRPVGGQAPGEVGSPRSRPRRRRGPSPA